MTADTAGSNGAAVPDVDDQRLSGECRNAVGIWGDRTCELLLEHVHCRNCPVYARTGRSLLDRTLDEVGEMEHVALRTGGDDPATTTQSYLLFRLQAEWCAFPTTFAREVVEPGVPHRVPHRNDPRFLGLVNVRGELILCADLANLLQSGEKKNSAGADPDGAKWARMIITDRESQAWAFPVDEIGGVRRVARSAIGEAPATVAHASPSFTTGIFDSSLGAVALLDDERIIYALRDICR